MAAAHIRWKIGRRTDWTGRRSVRDITASDTEHIKCVLYVFIQNKTQWNRLPTNF